MLHFNIPAIPQLAQKNVFGNVPDQLQQSAPRMVHRLKDQNKQAMLNKCQGGVCLKQPVTALNQRAGIAEQEAAVRRLFTPGRSQTDIDQDIETRLARTQQLKKAILNKAGMGNQVCNSILKNKTDNVHITLSILG